MSGELAQRTEARPAQPVDPAVSEFAAQIAGEESANHPAAAVLFYGSNLRTGLREGVLDFYVLTSGPQERWLWPRVSYREWRHGGETLRAKIAYMTTTKFAAAAAGETIDTTIWSRFVQPSALVWSCDEAARGEVKRALATAATTAAKLAAALGPDEGAEEDFWAALFRATYRAELRVEKPGRERSILDANAAHFSGLLSAAWQASGIEFAESKGRLRPVLVANTRADILGWWHRRRRLGKLLNIVRLIRASTTFDGAARYAAWKIERHTGVSIAVTPWRERHPLLAAPAVVWQLWRARRGQK